MATYKTPGVYVEEITTLPPSVAEVETAIPAFIGFTESGIPFTPLRIGSLREYENEFGGPEAEKGISVTISGKGDGAGGVMIDPATRSKNVLYYALQLYFANGGGACYIVPTGNYADGGNASIDLYNAALAALEKEDEPTLLVFPDAPWYLEAKTYYDLANSALMQCEKLGDRFAIIDVIDTGGLDQSKKDFRDAISANREMAKYGAAYYPYLTTGVNYEVDETQINVGVAQDAAMANEVKDLEDAAVAAKSKAVAARSEAKQKKDESTANAGDANLKSASDKAEQRASQAEDKSRKADDAVTAAKAKMKTSPFSGLSNALQNEVKKQIRDLDMIMTPCAAIAGVYANVDSTRGVWKAPANVSLSLVHGAAVKITSLDQEDLNVDTEYGKSINAIRSFTGKGTIVWGARTLTGNDNEWRYVSVRRFFNMVEESVKRSTGWAVFEPNDLNTWVRVQAMIENYLILKWKDGALAGTKPEDAFYVSVGIGKTMTPDDVLEGRMNVEIGMAAVRPAEFVVLKFSHKLQVS